MINLAIARKPATDKANRIGSLLFNFGGPGEGGASEFSQYLSSFDGASKTLNKRFDLVSWDPRGTGASSGIACTSKVETLEPDPDPTPETPEEQQTLAAKVERDTTQCLTKDGKIIPHADTWSTVRDLDAIRGALGDDQLSYVGFSYGTDLGMTYLATFPSKVRTMVLDGIDLPQDPVTSAHDQAVGFEHAVESYLADCQSQGSDCGFGNGNPQAAFGALKAQLEGGARIPANNGCSALASAVPERKGSVGIGEFDTAVAQAMYDKQLWPILSSAIGDATSASPDAGCLLALRDYYNGIQPDGSLSHLLDAFTAISCADQAPRAQNPLGDRPDLVAAWSQELPLVGAQFAEGLPGCWMYPPALHAATPFTAGQFQGIPPVVLVGNTGDPATPFAHAQAANALLPGSVLVTYNSTEHTVFLSHDSKCVDDPLVTYLTTRKLPSAGLACQP